MRIRKEQHHGKTRWLADGGTRDGKRLRKRFDSKKAVEKQLATWARETKEAGNVWLELPPRERAEVLALLQEIQGAGFSLREVWESFKTGAGADLVVNPISLDDAIKQAVDEKRAANRRAQYLREIESVWKQFARGRGTMGVHEVDTQAVKRWVFAAATEWTRDTRRSRLDTFFKWALKQGHTRRNPVEAVEKISKEFKPAEVFTPAECKRLMDAAWKIDRAAVGELALMLFAGVRPAEAQRLKPSDVDLKRKRVTIEAAAAKLRDRRISELEPTAAEWLRRSRAKGAVSVSIPIGTNRRRRLAAIRKEAKLDCWPKDVLRHTAASHLFLKFGAEETGRRLGHSERMLFQHYRDVVTPEESDEFWKIRPK